MTCVQQTADRRMLSARRTISRVQKYLVYATTTVHSQFKRDATHPSSCVVSGGVNWLLPAKFALRRRQKFALYDLQTVRRPGNKLWLLSGRGLETARTKPIITQGSTRCRQITAMPPAPRSREDFEACARPEGDCFGVARCAVGQWDD